MKRIYELLFYMGLSRAEFAEVKEAIVESNRKNMIVFSVIGFVAMMCMVAVSFAVDSLAKLRTGYLAVGLVCGLLTMISLFPAKKHRILTVISIYILVIMLFAFGIAMGTYIDPTEVTVSYIVFLFAVPLLFSDRPIRMNFVILISTVAYFIIARKTQDSVILGYNSTNVIPYSLLGMIVSTYMMNIKALRYSYEQKNKYLSESDQLTGLLNRHSYVDHIARIREKNAGQSITLCACDINGLKAVNDNLGHHAGDELIHGAADCIQSVLGRYGKCYRTGGDEFVAILEGICPTGKELEEMLSARTCAWKGTLVSGLSISVGIIQADSGNGIDEALQQADKAMYAYKEDYYKRTGIERRSART